MLTNEQKIEMLESLKFSVVDAGDCGLMVFAPRGDCECRDEFFALIDAAYSAGLREGMKRASANTVVECEPQHANDDGWCDWVTPKPAGYLMECCDCGLIHEAEFRVAKFQPRPSEEHRVVDDPDMQAQFRMKRRDDLDSAAIRAQVTG